MRWSDARKSGVLYEGGIKRLDDDGMTGSGDKHLIRGLWGHGVVSRESVTVDNERRLLKGRSTTAGGARTGGGAIVGINRGKSSAGWAG